MTGAAPRLSLVLVSYRMRRELPRSILSLCPPYQRAMAPDSYEIIVVENGDEARPALPETGGVALRWLRAEARSPSPVPALNQGLKLARGAVIGAWIDGARMASPGLLRSALDACAQAPRPVVATLNYQLGPVRQAMASQIGYDQRVEDGLLRDIGWPADGYRLFSIATPELKAPDRPMLETNALFLRAAMWRELGGFDPAFDEPGGGLANPDMLRRAVEAPGAQLIRITGEATFHQYHGGVSTSDPEQAISEVKRAARKYLALRGRPPRAIRDPGRLFASSVRAPAAG